MDSNKKDIEQLMLSIRRKVTNNEEFLGYLSDLIHSSIAQAEQHGLIVEHCITSLHIITLRYIYIASGFDVKKFDLIVLESIRAFKTDLPKPYF